MENNNLKEAAVAIILIGFFIALANPMHLWMPDMLHMTMLGLGFVVFGLYATFIMREKASDERDALHRMKSGRVAFLAGAGVLAVGIIYQSYANMIDLWLVFALVAMVVAKFAAHTYSDRNL